MKKLKVSMLALVFTVGIGGAFVQKIHAAPKQADATYHWLKYAANGVTRVPSQDENATLAQAQSDYGCSGAANRCATGTKIDSGDGPDTQILNFN